MGLLLGTAPSGRTAAAQSLAKIIAAAPASRSASRSTSTCLPACLHRVGVMHRCRTYWNFWQRELILLMTND